MNTHRDAVWFLTVCVLVGAAVAASVLFTAKPAVGSVVTGSEYVYATTSAAGLQRVKVATPVCNLGSVIISSSSATAFTVKNATSTTDVGSTTIATFEANAAEGTYTFDLACERGLAVDAPTGFNGYVITTFR